MIVLARWARLSLAGVGLAAATVALVPAPARAADGERIGTFAGTVSVAPSGMVEVNETIEYDFRTNERHGIFRFVPDRIPCEGAAVGPACPKGKVRTLLLGVRSVTMDGGSVPVSTERQGNATVLRIGDANRTVTGVHTYQLRYGVQGALNPTADGGAVLLWNVTGSGWTVPMDVVSVAVDAPAGPTIACRWGPLGSNTSCGESAPYTVGPLRAGEDVTLTVTMPAGAVATTAPRLDTPKRYLGPFELGIASYALAGVAALGGAGAVTAVARKGRDQRFVGGDVEVAMGRTGQAEETRPVFDRLPEVMEFAPPGDIRPGQLGALVDETVDSRDVAATIVDLAARGYLTLTELPGDDWKIGRGDKAPTPDLLPYETLLLDKLLGAQDEVQLSALRQKWSAHFQAVAGSLYESLVGSGWYRERPDQARNKANLAAVVQFVAGGVLIWFGRKGVLALAGVPLILSGVATLRVARNAGVRTAAGTAMAARCGGFRRLIETPTQQEMARFAERRTVFVEFLPFAIVFGCADQWAKRFAALGALPPPTGGWYVPLPGDARHRHAAAVGDASWEGIARNVSAFAGSAASSLSAAAASGSSGGSSGGGGGASSGGGFGGGGGGSW